MEQRGDGITAHQQTPSQSFNCADIQEDQWTLHRSPSPPHPPPCHLCKRLERFALRIWRFMCCGDNFRDGVMFSPYTPARDLAGGRDLRPRAQTQQDSLSYSCVTEEPVQDIPSFTSRFGPGDIRHIPEPNLTLCPHSSACPT